MANGDTVVCIPLVSYSYLHPRNLKIADKSQRSIREL